MRALRKEPIHRYNSMEQLSADLRRHLNKAPVLARDGNWLYYTSRFTRRHVFGVSVTAVFIVVLTAALITTSVQARRIAEQRDTANREKQTSEAVANFMVNVFAAADPFTVQNRQVTAGELLDKSIESIRKDLSQQPAVKARLLEAMGRSYARQGQPEQGVKLIEEAIQIRQEISDEPDESIALTFLNLGKAQLFRNDITGAESSLSKAKRVLEQKPRSKEYADVLVEFGRLELQKGNWKLALSYSQQALPLLREIYGSRHSEVAVVLMDVSSALMWQNDYLQMEKTAQETVEIFREVSPELHPDRLTAEGVLAEAIFNQGQIERAAPLYERALEGKRKVFGSKSSLIVDELNLMVKLRSAQGKLPEAEAFAREALEILSLRVGNDNSVTGYAKTTLAIVLWKQRKFSEAERELRSALSIYNATLPPDHGYFGSTRYYLAEALLAQRKNDEAAELLRSALSGLKRSQAPAWRIARAESALGYALFQLNDTKAAGEHLRNSYEILRASGGVDSDTMPLALKRLEEFSRAQNSTKTGRR
jgi:tetratricopeptide (TPR) repeat protein